LALLLNTTGFYPRKSAIKYFVAGLLVWAFLSGGVFAEEKAAPAAPAANSSASCLECHSDHTLSMRKQKRDISLFVDQTKLGKSAHSALDCVDCHEGFDGDSVPHKKPMTAVSCASCHEDMAKKHVFHAGLAGPASKAMNDVACTACHGTHEVA
jgi:nitrate/TMAO reductase-like tetraheme cytochrome c subunit